MVYLPTHWDKGNKQTYKTELPGYSPPTFHFATKYKRFKKQNMQLSEKANLLDDVLSNQEAREMVTKIVATHINFLKIKNLQAQVNDEKNDVIAQKRIPEINVKIAEYEAVLAQAKALNKKIVVQTTLNLSIAPD